MTFRVPFIKPSFPDAAEIAEDYKKILEANWFTNFGQFEKELRNQTAAFLGGGVHVCTVANATLGIEIAVRALLKKDEKKNRVLVPAFTFAAGPEVLISNDFVPVFIDMNDDVQPDVVQARAYIAAHKDVMAGILLCNIFGVGNVEIEEWEKLANQYGLPLIIDSAAGFGSQYSETEMVGVKGGCEVFSMHATKPFAVGEGGLVVTRDEALATKLRHIENFGFDDNHTISAIGTNAKLPELSCAIGLRQLADFTSRLAVRRDNLKHYKGLLEKHGYTFMRNDERSTVPFVTVFAKTPDVAKRVTERLRREGVEARNYYSPLHIEPQLMKYCEVADVLTRTEAFAERVVSLPLHDHMSIELIEDIVKTMVIAGK